MTNIEFTADGKFWAPVEEDGQGAHQHVRKVTGEYGFPGVVVGILRTTAGAERLVVQSVSPGTEGMLHIFAPSQMEPLPFPGDD